MARVGKEYSTTNKMARVGKLNISKMTGKLVVEWMIEDFFSIESEVNKGYASPSFDFIDEVWHLRVYPNGLMKITDATKDNEQIETEGLFGGNSDLIPNSEGYIDVYLYRKLSGAPIPVKFSLGLKTVDQQFDLKRHYRFLFDKKNQGHGTACLVKRSELLQNKSELAPANVLNLFCNLEYPEVQKLEKLSQDLNALMLSGDHSDTIIKVKGVEFRVHRNILSVRSPYFHAMFKSDMKEKSSGIVSIDDCEPDLFRSFIHFLYTGMVDKLHSENVCGLYEVSDKYQEDLLKKECLEFMVTNISSDSFCDFSALALKYDEKELLQESVEFFNSESEEIVHTTKWKNFMREYPMQANALIDETLEHLIK